MNETLSQLIRNTKEYSNVCDMCKDEILIYPTISGRTKYTQDEVEQITLKRIIDKLQAKEQECEELKNEYWKLEQDNDFLAEKNSRLKGCLAEIKEIAEPFCNACQEFEPEKKGSNCMYCNYGIILRKISEVEKWQIKNR